MKKGGSRSSVCLCYKRETLSSEMVGAQGGNADIIAFFQGLESLD